jgi:molybdopterin/thiamine biosynthesis adenylyltransferase
LVSDHDPLKGLPEVGPAARQRVGDGRVLIVGVGGLGVPAALSLAAAGVGTLGLIDGDVVDLSNLHRQIAYRTSDVGRPKVLVTAERIRALHSTVSVRCFEERLTASNLADVFPGFDFIIDGTDQIASKYLVNDGAVLHQIPFSHAGVLGFDGQTMTVIPHRSACLRCLFPLPPPANEVATCQEAGVIGPLPGSIGLVQAAEALKYLLGIGQLLAGRLLTYDAATGRWRTVAVSPNPNCPLCSDHATIRGVEAIGVNEDCL